MYTVDTDKNRYKKMSFERLVRLARKRVKNGYTLSEVGTVLEEIECRKLRFLYVNDSKEIL